MIIFYTVLTEKSGMGNYIRTKQIYNFVKTKKIAYLFVKVDRPTINVTDSNEYHGTGPVIRDEILNLLTEDKYYFVSDLPFLVNEDCEIHRHNNIIKVFSLNDATVNSIKPDYYFNTDDIVIPPIGTTSYIGHEYQIIREEILMMPSRSDARSINKIGVMFGGSDPSNLTECFVNSLLLHQLQEKYTFVILFGDKFDTSRVGWFSEFSEEAGLVVRQNTNIVDFYSDIDALVNMGGMSTYEALYLGIPVYSVEWSYMAKYAQLQSKRLGVHLLGDIDESVPNLQTLLCTHNQFFKQSSDNRKIDGLGSSRIAQIILKVCE